MASEGIYAHPVNELRKRILFLVNLRSQKHFGPFRQLHAVPG